MLRYHEHNEHSVNTALVPGEPWLAGLPRPFPQSAAAQLGSDLLLVTPPVVQPSDQPGPAGPRRAPVAGLGRRGNQHQHRVQKDRQVCHRSSGSEGDRDGHLGDEGKPEWVLFTDA